MEYKIGDIITTKKNHPCGSNSWEIIRTGLDYKIKCIKCGHIVMLSSEAFKRAIKTSEKK